MAICFECESRDCVCGYQGRNCASCFDCERRDCVCEKDSNESISITSEDDLQSGGLAPSKEPANLSFISADEEEGLEGAASSSTHFLPPSMQGSGGRSERATPPLRTGHVNEQGGHFEVVKCDRELNVGDFRPRENDVSRPDLTVFSVYSAKQVTIGTQETLEVPTNVIFHPEFAPLEQHPALFNFCPLTFESKNTTLAVKACQITGGAIYIGHQTSKRLCVLIQNPGSFTPISFPKDTMLGVLEIYYTRY